MLMDRACQCIMDAFQTFLRRDIVIHGAGRTDAGVHAKGQVAHMDLIDMYDPQALLNSVNALLPKSIRIFSIQVVPDNFHARFSAKGKIYHYLITQNAVCSPFTFPYRCHIKQYSSIFSKFTVTDRS